MPAIVKLSSRLPRDEEVNGVDAQKAALIDDPTTTRFAIVVYRTQRVVKDVDLGVSTPTIEILRFEPCGDTKTVPNAIREELIKSAQIRLNKVPLPFDELPEKITTTYAAERTDPIDFGDDPL